ncbi:alpha/beta hydrolase [Enterococcus avium]|uniref:alpha/beta hydrolase n=1 Tax=Enterococcus avium TaxID=33945 RepID=UPI0037B70975
MALLHYDFKSFVLQTSTSFYAVLPENDVLMKGDLQVLYLLHGMGDDHTKWIRRTNLEQYCKDYQAVVIMPQVEKSFYCNMAYGENYWDFLTEELPSLVKNLLPISTKREDTFVAGLSMGGFGAFKWALNKPESFSAAASFSGALDIENFFINEESLEEQFEVVENLNPLHFAIFGDTPIRASENDLVYLLQKNSDNHKKLPSLYQLCGTEDPILNYNQAFHATAKKIPTLDYHYHLSSGSHDWVYWDECIRQTLDFFKLRKKLK